MTRSSSGSSRCAGLWVVAVDAPLIIRNQSGPRAADAQADEFYGHFHAGAYPANLARFGEDHRGGRLLRALTDTAPGGRLVESLDAAGGPRLVFETYPHIVMVELFGLRRIIKYKRGGEVRQREGQQRLAGCIRDHLCGPRANPRLLIDDTLDALLREPDPGLRGKALKDREDKLDGLICACAAAWLDAGRPLQGLGDAGFGVMITPSLRGIRPPLR